MKKKIGLAIILAVVLQTGSSRLDAFYLLPEHWPTSSANNGIVMLLHLGSPGGTLIDGSTSWKDVAETALAMWNQRLAGSSFRFLMVREPTNAIIDGDRKNSVYFSNTVFGQTFGSGTLAVATRRSTKGVRNEADVIFNSARSWNSYRGAQRTASGGGPLYDFRRVALHEFGHVLGLDHPDDDGQSAQAIMKSAVGSLDDLQADDINGGRFLWAGTLPWRSIILPEPGTSVQTETSGSMQVKFANGRANGGFSGKVWFDGRVTVFRGVATNSNGNLLFGKGNRAVSPFHFPNHWERTLAFSWTESGLKSTFEDPWLISLGVPSTMSGILQSPRYHSKQPVPSWLLNSASKGLYNIAVTSKAQTPPISAATYPQGIGALATTLTRSGGLRLRGVLADGTKVTASSHLSDKTPFYVSFRTPGKDIFYNARPRGSFLGEMEFDTNFVNTDVRGINWMWFRGRTWINATRIPYSEGWPEGIRVDLAGVKYYADNRFFTLQQAMDLGPSDWLNGNARLQFTQGKLPASLAMSGFNIEGSKAVKISAGDKRFTLKMNANTGWIHGNFTPNWLDTASKLPTFQGVILHKGANKGGYGFFISNRLNDAQPESGRVILSAP